MKALVGMCIAAIAGFGGSSMEAATLRGSVLDEHHRPVAGAAVSLKSDARQEKFHSQTGADGTYSFTALPGGSYVLQVEMPGFLTTRAAPFIISDTEDKTVELTLSQAGEMGNPAFFDEPKFVVAGVTAGTYQGGHGSDVVLRSSEGLAHAAASLSKEPVNHGPQDRQRLRDAIAREPASADLHHRLADADEQAGDALEAVREYERAAKLDSSENDLFDWGTELLKHRADRPAIEVFQRGTRLFPKSGRMRIGLAAASYSLGDYQQAAREFFAACDVDPLDATPYLVMGKVRSSAISHQDGFLERMRRFASLEPENAWADYYYAESLWRRRGGPEDMATLRDVRKLLEQAIQIDAKLAPAYLLLGSIHLEEHNVSAAIAAFEKAAEAGPDALPETSEAHYRLAQAFRLAGETAKAAEQLAVYRKLSATSAREAERQRSEVQRFVFELRR